MRVFYAEDRQLPYSEIAEIANLLKSGAIGIFPTDTVYTVACSLDSPKAIERLCSLAGKKASQANLSLICSSFEMVADYTIPYSTATFRLMKSHLPGPYTFILNADVRKTRHWENKRKTIGIRLPDEAFLLKVIAELGHPLICSSLHSEDEIQDYFVDPEEIASYFSEKVDLFIHDGIGGTEASTVVDCTAEKPVLIKQGKGQLALASE